MRRKLISKGKSRAKPRMGILFGIPLLLFVSGIALISVGSYNYFKSAFYLSRLVIHDDINQNTKLKSVNSKTNTNKIVFPALGDKFGDIVIKSVDLNVPVYHGDREEELLKGAGHYNGSRFPGEGSNVVLAGHRNSVFSKLKDVVKGDTVSFNTTYGEYIYKISEIKIVKGNDKSIVQPLDSEKLTLYTCYPFDYVGNAPNRYVVICDLVQGTPLKELMNKEGGVQP
jgi:sortase A